MRDALDLLLPMVSWAHVLLLIDLVVVMSHLSVAVQLAGCIQSLAKFADKYKSLPTLGYTHFQ